MKSSDGFKNGRFSIKAKLLFSSCVKLSLPLLPKPSQIFTNEQKKYGKGLVNISFKRCKRAATHNLRGCCSHVTGRMAGVRVYHLITMVCKLHMLATEPFFVIDVGSKELCHVFVNTSKPNLFEMILIV